MAKPYRRGLKFRHTLGPPLLKCYLMDLEWSLGITVSPYQDLACKWPPMSTSSTQVLVLSSEEWLSSYVHEPYQPSCSFGPKSIANALRVADLQPFAAGLSFALCVCYRKCLLKYTLSNPQMLSHSLPAWYHFSLPACPQHAPSGEKRLSCPASATALQTSDAIFLI